MGLRGLVVSIALLPALLLGGGAGESALAGAPQPAARTSAAAHGQVTRHDPAWAAHLPARTRQVVRTISSDAYCRKLYCSVTQAWQRNPNGSWTRLRQFRSTIGAAGWGKRHEGDDRSPVGVYRIKVTFSTTAADPGRMAWRRRLPTSIVSAAHGRNYNTWVEIPGVTSGDRPSMRWGWVVDFNHVRLQPGVGPAPVPGRGSGIFYHTSRPGRPWAATAGCTQVGNPRAMHWLLTWLRPAARPRIVQGF